MANQEDKKTFPRKEWNFSKPNEVGINQDKLDKARKFQLEQAGNRPYRILIVRYGKIVAEWNSGIDPAKKAAQASASKSTFSLQANSARDFFVYNFYLFIFVKWGLLDYQISSKGREAKFFFTKLA